MFAYEVHEYASIIALVSFTFIVNSIERRTMRTLVCKFVSCLFMEAYQTSPLEDLLLT